MRLIKAPEGAADSPWLRFLYRYPVTVSDADQVVTLVASVPLTDEAWQPLAEGEVLAIQSGRCRARLRP